jgi:hypothetical protein
MKDQSMITFKNRKGQLRAVRMSDIIKVIPRDGFLQIVLQRGSMAVADVKFEDFVKRLGA